MRTKQCKLICRLPCLAVEPIRLEFLMPSRILIGGRVLWKSPDLACFAQFDGFTSFDEMASFWERVHLANTPAFSGVHIRWLPLPTGLDVEQ